MKWYEKAGNNGDVVLSTRIRLARNLVDYPFEPNLDEPSAKEIIGKVKAVFDGNADYSFVDFKTIDAGEALSYCEKHLVSREFALKKTPHALISKEDDGIYIMICEEDHLRIQVILPGLDLSEAYRLICQVDDELDGKLNIAYSDSLGYLTHCPTNLGTAMRASVMMHLPAMTMNREMAALRNQLEKIGLTIRGMSGEGSEAEGYLYQISNQITLGKTEEEILSDLSAVIEHIIERERTLRSSLSGDVLLNLQDKASRAYGTMKYAMLMSSGEFIKLYSYVRLGVAMGIVDEVDYSTLDKMLILTMPATLVCAGESELATSSEKRDVARAKMIRTMLEER